MKTSKTAQILNSLKQLLKMQGKTYAGLAGYLEVSEATVKRLFSKGQLSLERLEEICQFMDMELNDFFAYLQRNINMVEYLSIEQEEYIIADAKLLLITLCVINNYSFEDIISEYHVTEFECIQKLAFLDKIKVIDLLSNNRIKSRIAPNFSWLPNGPVQKFFQNQLMNEFFHSNFSQSEEILICRTGMITAATNTLIQRKLKQLAEEFNHLLQMELNEPLPSRQGSAMILALRPWNPKMLREYKK